MLTVLVARRGLESRIAGQLFGPVLAQQLVNLVAIPRLVVLQE